MGYFDCVTSITALRDSLTTLYTQIWNKPMHIFSGIRYVAPAVGLILLGLGRATKSCAYALGADQFGPDQVRYWKTILFCGFKHCRVIVHSTFRGFPEYNNCTVTTFNFYTKCMGILGIIQNLASDCHQIPGHGCLNDLTTERSMIRNLHGSSMCLPYVSMCFP